MMKIMRLMVLTIASMATQVYALNEGFNFGECSGSKSFEQQINYYNGNYENAITVGEIPQGIQGLHISLESDKDVDIRLYAGNEKIVHWPYGILSKGSKESKFYKNVMVTYSGYNGVNGALGHEYIEVNGTVPVKMTMKAFGYKAGYATVKYSWTGKEGCSAKSNGKGAFTQKIKRKEIVTVGTIPIGINALYVSLRSDKDLDIQLYGVDGTAIVKWPGGLLDDAKTKHIIYHDMKIEWSGYNGDGTGKGHEYIKITGKTSEQLTMKAYGYEAGFAEVNYAWNVNNTQHYTFDNTHFEKSLAIPALAPYTFVNGVKVFDMNIHESTTEFFAGIQTKTYGINANILGQTIRMHDGDKIKINYHNNLKEATTMHGHGMHVPAIMDGGPINKIQPGTTWSASYTVNQEASTNWYHPHLMGKTAEHVFMGLAGVIIVDSDESDALNLPKTYGKDDIPLVLQDKRFDANGQIDYSPTMMEMRRGYRSETMLVNGVITPHIDIQAKKIRFRLVNGSNARVYRLAFSNTKRFQQIATDNSFLEHPVMLEEVVLTPGERAEIIVDFSNDIGTDFVLKDLNSGLDMMKMNIAKASTVTETIPQTLTVLKKLNPAQAVRRRSFRLGMSRDSSGMHMSINGKTMNMKRIDEVVPVNDIEIWEITNMMGMEHNFHIHATHFYVIERDSSVSNVLENEKGYKDVVRVPPRSSVKVIVKMTDFVDEKHGYMYHCHFLEHEDDGMMGQFSVSKGKVKINVDGTSNGGMGGMGGM